MPRFELCNFIYFSIFLCLANIFWIFALLHLCIIAFLYFPFSVPFCNLICYSRCGSPLPIICRFNPTSSCSCRSSSQPCLPHSSGICFYKNNHALISATNFDIFCCHQRKMRQIRNRKLKQPNLLYWLLYCTYLVLMERVIQWLRWMSWRSWSIRYIIPLAGRTL